MAASTPSSSSSDEVVDLGLAADLDDATSRIFFSDGDGDVAGADLRWPAAEQLRSTLTTQAWLRRLCDSHGVPEGYVPRCAGNLPPCATPPAGSGAICVYADALEAGMRLPLHGFYAALLRHYGLAPSQLSPKAWRYMVAFLLLCEDAGADPMPSVFHYFFSIRAGRGSSGWLHFEPTDVTPYADGRRRRLFGGMTTKVTGKPGRRFFFLEPPPGTPWPHPTRWGKPQRASVRRATVGTMSSAAKAAAMKLLDVMESRGEGATGIDVKWIAYLPERDLPVGRRPTAGAATSTPLQARVKEEPAAVAAARESAGESSSNPPPTTTGKRKRLAAMANMVTPPPTGFGVHWRSPGGFTFRGSSDGGAAQLPEAATDDENVQLQVKVAELQGQLREAKEWKTFYTVCQTENAQLLAERKLLKEEHAAEVAKLNREHAQLVDRLSDEQAAGAARARLKEEHAAEVAKLKQEHAQLVDQLRAKHAAGAARLKEEYAADVARVVDAAAKELLEAKRGIVLSLFPHLDASLLQHSSPKGNDAPHQ